MPAKFYCFVTLAALLTVSASAHLLKALKYAPTNIVIRLRAADLEIDRGKPDSATAFLQDIKRLSPDFSAEVRASHNELIQLCKMRLSQAGSSGKES